MSFQLSRFAVALCLTLISVGVSAQVIFTSNHALIPGTVEHHYLPTAAYPFGNVGNPGLQSLPNAALLPPLFGGTHLVGGMASDDRNAWIYTTNGDFMAMDMNPNFTVFGFTSAPPLIGIAPVPSPHLGPVRISGLGFDDANNLLWACDNGAFWAMNPVPPFNPLTPYLPIPGFLGGSITGLDFDAATGSLWACSDMGNIYNFSTAGTAIGPQPVSVVSAGGPLGGLAVATHNGPGSISPPLF